MATAEDGEHWTGPRLTARFIALKGIAPEPAVHIVFRSTRRVDGTTLESYAVPDEAQPLEPEAAETWIDSQLGRGERLAVAVLVIREILDTRGMILQCTIERRRGSVDGPFCGDPVRVDFAGPASAVRLYRSHLDGRLTEVAPSADIAPPRVRSPEQFSGELKALHARYGPGVRVLDSREPTLFEDMVGLSSIVHVRTVDARDIGCGIGWHGKVPFVLEADFPRFAAPFELPPEDAAAIEAALRDNDLVRGETRLDQDGIAVVARRRGTETLFLLRPSAGTVRPDPHVPNRSVGGPDQQRWMRYVETYEGLTVLDAWRDGTSEDLIVLAGDLSGQVWRHHIDIDGVETWRKADDEAAVGALHREQLFPGTLASTDDLPPADNHNTISLPELSGSPGDRGSLLFRAEAYIRAMHALSALREAQEARPHLHMLSAALADLDAHLTAAMLRNVPPQPDAASLTRLQDSLRAELALSQCYLISPPHAQRLARDDAPFGEDVAAFLPDVSYDIEEAALCLALSRPTAAVFHCMKVLQAGIAEFARIAGIENPIISGSRWSLIMHSLQAAGAANLQQAFTALDAIRRGWRAATLLPADKYTEQEAERIFRSLETFLRALAKSDTSLQS